MNLSKKTLSISLGVILTMTCMVGIAVKSSETNQQPIKAAAADTTALYADCETAVSNKSLSGLWTAVKVAAASGFSAGSYNALWTKYKTTDIRSDGKIFDWYSESTNFTPGTGQCGTYSVEGDCYNREHSIPKSWWGGAETNQGADMYIVVPTDGKVNGMRSSYPFGEVATATYTSNSGAKLGSSSRSDYSGTVFEPYASMKGDFARNYFYAVAKWPSVNMTSGNGSSTFSGSESTNYGLTAYGKAFLTEWANADPVSDREITRNDNGQSVQGNRNPFVDHPEYASYLWGGVEIGSLSSSATAPTDLTISGPNPASVSVGGTAQLSVSTTTTGASTSVTWSSGTTSVATVSTAGVVTGVAAGTSVITATSTLDTAIKATFTITVKALSSLSYSGTPTTTTYDTSMTFDPTGITITANFTDGTSTTIDNSLVTWGSLNTDGTVVGTYGGKSLTVSGLTVTLCTTAGIGITVTNSNLSSTASATEATKTYTLDDNSTSFDVIWSNSLNNTTYNEIQVSPSGYLKNGGSIYVKSIIIDYYSAESLSVTANGSAVTGETATASFTTKGTVKKYTINSATWAINNTSASTKGYAYTIYFECDVSDVDRVSLDQSSLSMAVGGSDVTLTATASGAVTWSSNAEGVATVSNGVVHAVSTGNAVITATCGSATANCAVTVTDPSLDSVTLNASTLSLKVGQTNTLVATASGTVTWSSDSANATVSNGIVTAVSVGNATITATCGSASATCNVTISAADVVSSSTISFLATGENDGSTELTSKTILDNITAGADLIKSYDTLTKLYAGKNGLKLGSSKGAGVLTFTLADKIAAKTVSKITVYGVQYGSDKGTLDLFVNDSATALSSAAPSAAGTEATVGSTVRTISVHSTKRAYLTSIKLDFAGSTEYTADTFAQDFLDNVTCDSTGATAPTLSKTWSELTNLYSSISSETEKAKLLNAAYTVAGTGASTVVTASGSTTSVVANAMYRYDYIITKYGTTTYTNFITGRTPSALNVSPISQNTDSSNYIPLIVIISLASVTAIGGYFYIKLGKKH